MATLHYCNDNRVTPKATQPERKVQDSECVMGQRKREGDGRPKEKSIRPVQSLSVLQSSQIEGLKWRLDAVPESQVTEETRTDFDRREGGTGRGGRKRASNWSIYFSVKFFYFYSLFSSPRVFKAVSILVHLRAIIDYFDFIIAERPPYIKTDLNLKDLDDPLVHSSINITLVFFISLGDIDYFAQRKRKRCCFCFIIST